MPLHVVLTALWGCGQGTWNTDLGQARSGTVVEVSSSPFMVAANVDEGSVTLVDPLEGWVRETHVGPEPTRISAAAGRVWVSLRLDGELAMLELRDDELMETGRMWVGSEPYGVVASASGDRVYVAVSMDDAVLELDGETLEPLRRFEIPGEPRWLALRADGRALAVASARGTNLHVVNLPNGKIVERVYPFEQINAGAGSVNAARGTGLRISGDIAYHPHDDALYVPFAVMTNPIGPGIRSYYAPTGEPAVVVGRLVAYDDEGEPSVVADSPHYINHVSFDSTGGWWYTLEEGRGAFTAGGQDGRSLFVGNGASGVAVDRDGGRWAHLAHDVALQHIGSSDLRVDLAEPSMDPVLRRGRQLFFSAIDGNVSSGTVSCAGCHADGRSDGRTWSLITGEWQTPSLGGNVDGSTPVTWTQGVDSVREEAIATSTGPMGGVGMFPDDLDALVSFVNSVRLPNPPTQRVSDDVLSLGREVFHRPDVGCFECHPAPSYTDNLSHRMFDVTGVYTPSLRGVAATAPYLHDGRAETLRGVLDRSVGGEMGHPERLTEDELDALVAWLRTL